MCRRRFTAVLAASLVAIVSAALPVSAQQGAPRPGGAVEVSFATATDVAMVRSRRRGDVRWADTTWLRAAYSVSGRVTAVRGDTVRVAVRDARDATGRTTIRHRPIVTVVPAAGVDVQLLSRRPGLANGVVLGIIAAIVGTLYVVFSSD